MKKKMMMEKSKLLLLLPLRVNATNVVRLEQTVEPTRENKKDMARKRGSGRVDGEWVF